MHYVKYKFLVTQMNFIHFQAFSENPNLDFPYPWTSLISAEIFWDARPLFMTFLGAAIITFAYGAIGDARCSHSLQELMPLVSRVILIYIANMRPYDGCLMSRHAQLPRRFWHLLWHQYHGLELGEPGGHNWWVRHLKEHRLLVAVIWSTHDSWIFMI